MTHSQRKLVLLYPAPSGTALFLDVVSEDEGGEERVGRWTVDGVTLEKVLEWVRVWHVVRRREE